VQIADSVKNKSYNIDQSQEIHIMMTSKPGGGLFLVRHHPFVILSMNKLICCSPNIHRYLCKQRTHMNLLFRALCFILQ